MMQALRPAPAQSGERAGIYGTLRLLSFCARAPETTLRAPPVGFDKLTSPFTHL